MGSLRGLQTFDNEYQESSYIFGLWCADGYFWSSSIGVSNTDIRLIQRFSVYLRKLFPKHRIKLRRYSPETTRLARKFSYHLYVNSRELIRLFKNIRNNFDELSKIDIPAYFAGRFDGDGCIHKDLRRDLRISYGNQLEAELDEKLLHQIGEFKTKIYWYRTSGTYVLYVSRFSAGKFVEMILPYSNKLQSRIAP